MKVGIIGSRNIKTYALEKMLLHIPLNCTEVISGGAEGVDQMARAAAAASNCKFIEILPNYKKYGKNAPIVRNLQLVKKCDMVLAFWDFYSKGTASAINFCIHNHIPFKIIPIN